MTPLERYSTDPAFAAAVDRCAAECSATVGEVLRGLQQLQSAARRPFEATIADTDRAVFESVKPMPPPASDYRPGARLSGSRPAPPMPRWARKRGRS